jgi:hypothetical protein
MDSENDDYEYEYDDGSYGSDDVYGPEDVGDPMVLETMKAGSENPNAAPTIAGT